MTKFSVLSEILQGLGLNEAAERIVAPDESLLTANGARIEEARVNMRRSGAEGVPALLVGEGQHRLVQANALFGNIDALIAALQA